MYFIHVHWPAAKVGDFFSNKGGTEVHLSRVPANVDCVPGFTSDGHHDHTIINVAKISSMSLIIMEIFSPPYFGLLEKKKKKKNYLQFFSQRCLMNKNQNLIFFQIKLDFIIVLKKNFYF